MEYDDGAAIFVTLPSEEYTNRNAAHTYAAKTNEEEGSICVLSKGDAERNWNRETKSISGRPTHKTGKPTSDLDPFYGFGIAALRL